MFKRVLLLIALVFAIATQLSHLSVTDPTTDFFAARNTRPRPTRTPKPTPTPTFTPTPTPSPTATPTPLPTPTPTLTPTPTPSPTPTPTPTPSPTPFGPTITSVARLDCTPGSSCYSYLTSFDVRGTNFASNSLVYIKPTGTTIAEKLGSIVSRIGSTRIIVDYINLPHCTLYDVKVSGSTGVATAYSAVSSICP